MSSLDKSVNQSSENNEKEELRFENSEDQTEFQYIQFDMKGIDEDLNTIRSFQEILASNLKRIESFPSDENQPSNFFPQFEIDFGPLTVERNNKDSIQVLIEIQQLEQFFKFFQSFNEKLF
jgi:hypothetical protein